MKNIKYMDKKGAYSVINCQHDLVVEVASGIRIADRDGLGKVQRRKH